MNVSKNKKLLCDTPFTKLNLTRMPVRNFLSKESVDIGHDVMIKPYSVNYLFEKMCDTNFSKLALVCISYHCGAWYAFHTIAEIV